MKTKYNFYSLTFVKRSWKQSQDRHLKSTLQIAKVKEYKVFFKNHFSFKILQFSIHKF